MQVLKKITRETNELNKQISLLKAEMQTKTREYMKDVFEEFFNTYEDLVDSIFWTQATPFFNDGEECVFGVNEICILLKSDIFEDGEVADYISDYEGSELITSGNLANDFSEISDFLGSIDSEIMKAVFGDHSKIIVRKDKIEIEEFMHD